MALGTPPAVAIDEAIELARRFSGEDSVQFINGASVLNNVSITNANSLTLGNGPTSTIQGSLNFNGSAKPLGGSVSFGTNSKVQGSAIEVHAEPAPSGGFLVRVANLGTAIPPDVLPTLFGKYRQGTNQGIAKRYGGWGLGLAFCRLADSSWRPGRTSLDCLQSQRRSESSRWRPSPQVQRMVNRL